MIFQSLRRLAARWRQPAPATAPQAEIHTPDAIAAGPPPEPAAARDFRPAQPVDARSQPAPNDSGRRYTWEDCYANLVMLEQHYGRMPRRRETMRPPSFVGISAYVLRFGGWTGAIRAYRAYRAGDRAAWPMPGGNPGNTSLATPAARARAKARYQKLVQSGPVNSEIGSSLRYKILKRDKHRCTSCGADPKTDARVRLHVDHKIPRSKGGKSTPENLRTLCAKCNLGKGARLD